MTDDQILNLAGIPFEKADKFLPDIETRWVQRNYFQQLLDNKIDVMLAPQILSHHLAHVLRRYASKFVGIQETHLLLAQVESQYSELIKEMYRNMSIGRVAGVLRRLVNEDVSINNLRAIMEALVIGASQSGDDDEALVEFVRSHLKDQISYRYCIGNNVLPVILIDPTTEDILVNSIRQTPQGVNLALESADSKGFLDAIRNILGGKNITNNKVALITSLELRHLVRKLIEQDFYQLPVLSFPELAAQINVQPIGRVSLTRLEAA